MRAETLAWWESKIRVLATSLSPHSVVSMYSSGRQDFLKKFAAEQSSGSYHPPPALARMLWGITFLSPIMNAAGMWKDGQGYEIVAAQGPAAFHQGTTTWLGRRGNKKKNIYLPFVPYPNSGAASNWLGLPGAPDASVAARTQGRARMNSVPVGHSLMASPDLNGQEKLERLVDGMRLYNDAGVDFLEINESCPNTAHGRPQDDDLYNRLKFVKERFLDRRERRIPVIVKFSTDTPVAQVPQLLDLLFELGFDGANFGNTSTDYAKRRKAISAREHALFDYFTSTFGGGVSGRPLKESSLELCSRAVEYLRRGPPSQEFHVIRTGGIEGAEDIRESERIGVQLSQWFTGYWQLFARHGHHVYAELYKELLKK